MRDLSNGQDKGRPDRSPSQNIPDELNNPIIHTADPAHQRLNSVVDMLTRRMVRYDTENVWPELNAWYEQRQRNQEQDNQWRSAQDNGGFNHNQDSANGRPR